MKLHFTRQGIGPATFGGRYVNWALESGLDSRLALTAGDVEFFEF
jgi:hypothetical protein